jgi:hypothetical protein
MSLCLIDIYRILFFIITELGVGSMSPNPFYKQMYLLLPKIILADNPVFVATNIKNNSV